MKRVVVLSHRDIRHYAGGGAPLYVHQILQRLTHKYEITIISTTDSTLPRREVIDGITVIRLPHPRFARLLVPLSTIARIIGRADVVIDNGDVAVPWLTPAFVRGPKLCIVYQVAGDIFHHELRRPIADIAGKIEPWIYRAYGNTKIVTCSNSTKNDLVGLGLLAENISVIRPGINKIFLEFEPTGTKFDSPTIVCISRFVRYKGLHYAIQAMRYITESVPDAQLIIVGNGDDSIVKRELSNFPFSDSIKIVKRAPHSWDDEKKRLLSFAHVLIVPSVREGYGIVAIEANACGTSAVAWDVPGLRDSILDGETGTLVEFGDTEALAKRVVTLLRDRYAREKMAASALKWARTHSWDQAATEFGNILDSFW